ncbi:hypothetical protein ACIQ2D_10035 [Lysinibacillus sp. NPDC097287]|uniref:hypothetical protein n=1 Tax=Lysinibacillus sp. NPDC097287 TaxID=3364144 RepID=UPI00380D3577
MGIFLLIMGLFIVVGVISTLQKESRHNDSSSRNHSNSASTNTTDIMTTGAIFSLQDTVNHDCSDNTSSHSDSSGGSSCD